MLQKTFQPILALIMALTLWHCQSDESPSAPKPNAVTNAEPSGVIQIILRGSDTTASFLGKIYDGPQPSNTIWEEQLKAGCMKVVKPRIPFCAKPCGSDSACVADDSCQVYPTAIEAGALRVSGLKTNKGTAPFTISPLNSIYQAVGLVYPPFNEGDSVSITAAGSDASPPFVLNALGLAPLKPLTDTVLHFADGKPIELLWEAPGKDIHSIIDVVIDLTFHGGTKAKIEGRCDDTGKLTIPANLLDKLKTYGVSGFPRINMTRLTSGSDANAKTELTLESTISLALAVPGVISCNKDADCPDDGKCLPDRRCE